MNRQIENFDDSCMDLQMLDYADCSPEFAGELCTDGRPENIPCITRDDTDYIPF